MTSFDPITKAEHYNKGRRIEVLDILEDNVRLAPDAVVGSLQWSVLKYICRLWSKGNDLQDAQKARFYLDRLIAHLEDRAAMSIEPPPEGALEEEEEAFSAEQLEAWQRAHRQFLESKQESRPPDAPRLDQLPPWAPCRPPAPLPDLSPETLQQIKEATRKACLTTAPRPPEGPQAEWDAPN